MKLTFHGAAQHVTGSKHLLEANGFRLLLDCGLHQGPHKVVDPLNHRLPFPAKSIDAAVLSHGHLDHCGLLPLLVKDGFTGPLYCTPATADVAELILRDSAHIQVEDAEFAERHRVRGTPHVRPTYDQLDVANLLPHIRTVPYFRHVQRWQDVGPGIRLKFYDAGHILGSAVTVLEVTEAGRVRYLAFTGDLGRRQPVIIHAPEQIAEPVSILLSECTYGDHNHRMAGDVHGDLERAVKLINAHKGKLIIPAFAMGRTQEVVYALHHLTDTGRIPRMPVYVDSPLGVELTELFSKYPDDFNGKSWQDFGQPYEWPLVFRNLHYVRARADSEHLVKTPGPMVIIAASGMAEGGRVLHHLRAGIEDPRNLVLFTGYQGEHTLGRQMLEHKPRVWIHGEDFAVRANIGRLYEFSAHADQADLLAYYKTLPKLAQVFLVHTETPQAQTFTETLKRELPALSVHVPLPQQTFEV